MSVNENSIVLISSKDSSNRQFGTGFVVHKDASVVYVVTCAHVINDVGGAGEISVEGISSTVVASGDAEGIDLAVLKVEGLWERESLVLETSGYKGNRFETVGFRAFGSTQLVRPIQGSLGERVGLQSQTLNERVPAWDLCIDPDETLERGYSGSPIFDEHTGNVLAVVSHRQGTNKGLAICISSLSKIWQILDSKELMRTLLNLGYHQQDRLFRQLLRNKAVVAAFLIHGLPEYCPQWLLNRLMVKHLTSCWTGRIVKAHLNRRGRGISVESLWRELGSKVGARERSPTVIADRIIQWWQTQDVVIIIHHVDLLPKAELHSLISDFWGVLLEKIDSLKLPSHNHKLFMFLIDYNDKLTEPDSPFVQEVGATWQPPYPVEFPNLSNFSDTDFLTWIDYEFEQLPKVLKDLSEEDIHKLLEASDDGIPQYTFEELCSQCGCNWYDESEKWLQRVN